MEQRSLKIFQNDKISGVPKAFSVLVAVLPVLASYASGMPGFTVADVCLVLFVGLSILKRNNINIYRVQVNSLFFGLAWLIFFAIVACAAGFPSSVSDVFVRTVRYVFYMVVLFTAGKKFLNIAILINAIKTVSFLGSVFIIFQAAIYKIFDVVVRGHLPFLNLYTDVYSSMDYETIYKNLMYRPTSFFLEPAHYARYCIIGLVLYLFDDAIIDNKSLSKVVICAVGIIISTSSQGYFLLTIILSMFLFTRIKNVKSQMMRVLLGCVLLISPLLVTYLLQLPVVAETINRTLSGNIMDPNSSIGARLGGFISYIDLPLINKLIGTGFGNVPDKVWLSSAAYWLYGSGIIVFLIYIYFFLRTFFQLDRKGKYILFVIIFLFITDDSFYNYMVVLYFSLILFKPKRSGM